MEINAFTNLIESSRRVLLGENGDEIVHKGSCHEVHPDMSHEEWEKEQRIQSEEEPSENESEDIVNVESVELDEWGTSYDQDAQIGDIVDKDRKKADARTRQQWKDMQKEVKANKKKKGNDKLRNIPPKPDSSFRGSEDLLNTIKQIGSAHGPNRPK